MCCYKWRTWRIIHHKRWWGVILIISTGDTRFSVQSSVAGQDNRLYLIFYFLFVYFVYFVWLKKYILVKFAVFSLWQENRRCKKERKQRGRRQGAGGIMGNIGTPIARYVPSSSLPPLFLTSLFSSCHLPPSLSLSLLFLFYWLAFTSVSGIQLGNILIKVKEIKYQWE